MRGRILVPLDGSPGSGRGLDTAIDMARSTHGLLRLVHVLDDLSLPRRLADTDTWLDALRHGGQQILEAARRAAASASPFEFIALRASIGPNIAIPLT